MLNRKPYVDDFASELSNRACDMLKSGKVDNEKFLDFIKRINYSNDAYYNDYEDEVFIMEEMIETFRWLEAQKNEREL